MRRIVAALLFLALALQCAFNPAYADTRPAPEDRGASGLALALRRLQTVASALHTARILTTRALNCSLISLAEGRARGLPVAQSWRGRSERHRARVVGRAGRYPHRRTIGSAKAGRRGAVFHPRF